MKNCMEIKFKAIAENESFARNVVGSFILPLNPSLSEMEDIITAVNEAVTNVIVHAYPDKTGYVSMKIVTQDNKINITITDNGIGIKDIERALTPFYTSKPDQERSGMGFTVMESFMDKLEVKNNKEGLTVSMTKEIDNNVVGL
ncbi:MAG TPA: anti-sigma F factor [Candidatus Onthoplasma faecigallinarum]|nr:anti-sigma F factor [Candidatus Onthoplasma faecigallinarum]